MGESIDKSIKEHHNCDAVINTIAIAHSAGNSTTLPVLTAASLVTDSIVQVYQTYITIQDQYYQLSNQLLTVQEEKHILQVQYNEAIHKIVLNMKQLCAHSESVLEPVNILDVNKLLSLTYNEKCNYLQVHVQHIQTLMSNYCKQQDVCLFIFLNNM